MPLQSPRRLPRLPLWQWGLICIVAGVLANMAMAMMHPVGARPTAADRGAVAGRGVATLLFVLIGAVLIVVHFVRGGSSKHQ